MKFIPETVPVKKQTRNKQTVNTKKMGAERKLMPLSYFFSLILQSRGNTALQLFYFSV